MMSTGKDDDFLIAGLRQSDPVAFKFIYELYWQRLYNIAYYYTHSEQEAEDIVQDVFISLWSRREKLLLKGALENYLVRCAKYTAFFYLKIKQKRSITYSLDNKEAVVNDAEEYIYYRDMKGYISSLFDSVSKKTRDIFYLSRFDGLTYHEISEKLNISVKTVEYHISIALKKLSLEDIR